MAADQLEFQDFIDLAADHLEFQDFIDLVQRQHPQEFPFQLKYHANGCFKIHRDHPFNH